MKVRCTECAYTLIEILVGLTIIGLLFGFGFVSFRDFSRRQAISGAAKNIQGDLRLAQGDAVSGQKPEDANCNSPNVLTGYAFNVVSDIKYSIEADCVGNGTSNVTDVKDVNLPSDIKLVTPSPNPLIFKVLGQGTNLVSGSDWILTLNQVGTTNTLDVTVTSGGEIQ